MNRRTAVKVEHPLFALSNLYPNLKNKPSSKVQTFPSLKTRKNSNSTRAITNATSGIFKALDTNARISFIRLNHWIKRWSNKFSLDHSSTVEAKPTRWLGNCWSIFTLKQCSETARSSRLLGNLKIQSHKPVFSPGWKLVNSCAGLRV